MAAGKRICVVLAVFLLFSRAAAAFEWPVEDVSLVSTFGQDRWGDYLKGIELHSPLDRVEAVEAGEVIFFSNETGGSPHKQGSGLGNMVVVQHERNIRSVYGHLSSPFLNGSVLFSADQELGKIGSTGMTEGRFLYLQIIDSEVSRFVNPLLSLPSVADKVRPSIEEIVLEYDDDEHILRKGMSAPQGRCRLHLRAYDTSTALKMFKPMSVYSVKLYINGEERQSFSFESLAIENGRVVPAGRSDLSHEALYGEGKGISLGFVTLQPGEAVIEVVVADFAGNEKILSMRIYVRAE